MFLGSFVKKHVLSCMLIVLLCLVMYRFVWRYNGFAEQLCSYITYPVILFSHIVVDPIKVFITEKNELRILQEKIVVLQKEMNVLRAENSLLLAEKSYEYETRDLRDFKKKYELSDAVISQVLVRHFSDRAHYFLIDGGTNKNIQPGMVAICNNSLLGRVAEVYPWYSKVILITDKLCKIAALDTKTQALGVLEGANQEHAFLRYIDHLSSVQVGDVIISSGQGLIFPQGFGLGTVTSVDLQGLHYEITVAPLIELTQVDYCLLISKESMNS